MLDNKEKSQIQEKLVRLYLRLNGYFTEGFIAHNETRGRIYSEIDMVGVRLPYHSEVERDVRVCPRLQFQAEPNIDVLIGEVKSHGVDLRFNNALSGNIDVLRKTLNRVGAVTSDILEENIQQIHELFHPNNIVSNEVKRFRFPGSNISISAFLFAPETVNQRDNQNYFIREGDIFSYIWRCFRPEVEREGCATRYDFSAWGEYEEIVRYFKDRARLEQGGRRELYQYIEARRG